MNIKKEKKEKEKKIHLLVICTRRPVKKYQEKEVEMNQQSSFKIESHLCTTVKTSVEVGEREIRMSVSV